MIVVIIYAGWLTVDRIKATSQEVGIQKGYEIGLQRGYQDGRNSTCMIKPI